MIYQEKQMLQFISSKTMQRTRLSKFFAILILLLSFLLNPSQADIESQLDFILHTSNSAPFYFKTSVDPFTLLHHGFDPDKPTKIIAHGWAESGTFFTSEFSTAYFQAGLNYNIIGIDWEKLAPILNYVQAAWNSNEVGNLTGEKIIVNTLVLGLNQDPSQISAIGHSLGAHLVGLMGRKVQELTGHKLTRITGKYRSEMTKY